MTDYIKREDAIKAVVNAKTGKDKTIDGTRQVTDCLRRINDIPSADVVEVVRCKDCKHWNNDEPDFTYCAKGAWYGTDKDDFCSFGERRRKR